MSLLGKVGWNEIDTIRQGIGAHGASCLEDAAQHTARTIAQALPSIVLCRLFGIVTLDALPESDRAFAQRLSPSKELHDKTRILSLLGTHGRKREWCARARSQGHLAIPLIDRASVKEAPMIAKLLADLEVDLEALDDGRPIVTRKMLGGNNGTFFVPDAQAAFDLEGRAIIPSRSFIEENDVRTVFGMGGSYISGILVVAILFTDELVERVVVDRFPSLISNFKMATALLVEEGKIYRDMSKGRSGA